MCVVAAAGAGCGGAKYCSARCQKEHWKDHKKPCKASVVAGECEHCRSTLHVGHLHSCPGCAHSPDGAMYCDEACRERNMSHEATCRRIRRATKVGCRLSRVQPPDRELPPPRGGNTADCAGLPFVCRTILRLPRPPLAHTPPQARSYAGAFSSSGATPMVVCTGCKEILGANADEFDEVSAM